MSEEKSTREFFEQLDWGKKTKDLAVEAGCSEANIRLWKSKLGKTKKRNKGAQPYLMWFRMRVNTRVDMTAEEVATSTGCPAELVPEMATLFGIGIKDLNLPLIETEVVDWDLPNKVIQELFDVSPPTVTKFRQKANRDNLVSGSWGNYSTACEFAKAILAQAEKIQRVSK